MQPPTPDGRGRSASWRFRPERPIRVTGRPVSAAAGALVVGLVLAACGAEAAPERPAGVLVDTTTVATQDVPRVLRAVGTVEAENQTVVKTEVDGQISRIVADEGARVNEGDVILQIDPTPFRLAYDQARAARVQAQTALENDQRLLERYSKLLEAGALDQQSYDDVAARVNSERAALAEAQARVQQAEWNLSKTTVRAPFAGWVADRKIELGSYVSSGDDLFEVVDPTPIRVAFEVPETDVGRLTEGDPVSFTVRTNPGETYEGRVIYVSPALDPETRTQPAKAEYPNEKGEVTPGAFADIEVVTAVRRDAPVIPEVALVSEGEQSFVWVVQDGRATKREIALGQRLENGLEVLKGLQGGEIIVVEGQRELREEAPVRYAEAPATPAGEVGPGRRQVR
jgi:RND family efflux transporter MFP subunit